MGSGRFSEHAKEVLVRAEEEARALGHGLIGTEHLLLGVLMVEDGLGAIVLRQLGVTLEGVRPRVAGILRPDDQPSAGSTRFTPSGENALELALQEALSLGQSSIGTEHLLLGIARASEGGGARILRELDANEQKIRDEVTRVRLGRPPEHQGRTAPLAVGLALTRPALLVALVVGIIVGWLVWGH